jgi:hypothetical protein
MAEHVSTHDGPGPVLCDWCSAHEELSACCGSCLCSDCLDDHRQIDPGLGKPNPDHRTTYFVEREPTNGKAPDDGDWVGAGRLDDHQEADKRARAWYEKGYTSRVLACSETVEIKRYEVDKSEGA